MNQTIAKYGAVTIYQCLTTRFEQREESDPSGTDAMGQRFTISVVGFCHGKDTDESKVQATPQGDNAAETYRNLSEILSARRLQFIYTVGADDDGANGVEVFNIQATDNSGEIKNDRDIANGPRCTQFNVSHVIANELWKVEATFEICIPNCSRAGSNDSRVLSNKWSVTDTIGKDKYLTRTYQGRLRVSSGKINPNSFRGMVVPILVPGMRRESMDFQASADGLWLAYTIVDSEAAYAAPDPATSWEIVHSERTGLTALIGEGDIQVSLSGDRNVDRKALISLGLKVMNDRLRFGAPLPNNPDHFITELVVTDYLGSEGPLRITISARVKHVAKGEAADINANIIFAKAKIGTPIDGAILAGYDPDRSRGGRVGEQPETSGPIPLAGAFVTYLQTVCNNIHDIGQNQDTRLVNPTGRTGDGPAVTGRIVPGIPDEPPPYIDPSHNEAMYLNYRMESRYDTNMRRVVLPIADDPSRLTSEESANADTQAIITLAPPGTRRTMRLQASRIGREPELPAPVDEYTDDSGRIAVLLRTVVLPAVPQRLGDGKQYMTVDAEYHYALKRPAKSTDKVRVGVNPWERSGLYRASERLFGSYSEDSKSGASA